MNESFILDIIVPILSEIPKFVVLLSMLLGALGMMIGTYFVVQSAIDEAKSLKNKLQLIIRKIFHIGPKTHA